MSATNSFPKNEAQIKKIVEKEGFNPSLPFCFFKNDGQLLYANNRMRSILEISPDFPVKEFKIDKNWSFHNEEMGAPAILRSLLDDKRSGHTAIVAQWGTKSYRLESSPLGRKKQVLIVAQLIRRGDLLEDKESRQLLFRVVSHEVRTNIQVLKGYVDMLPEEQALIRERMESSLERLQKVVQMLEDLKVELEIKV